MHDGGQKKLSTTDTLTLRRRAKAEAVSKTGEFNKVQPVVVSYNM